MKNIEHHGLPENVVVLKYKPHVILELFSVKHAIDCSITNEVYFLFDPFWFLTKRIEQFVAEVAFFRNDPIAVTLYLSELHDSAPETAPFPRRIRSRSLRHSSPLIVYQKTTVTHPGHVTGCAVRAESPRCTCFRLAAAGVPRKPRHFACRTRYTTWIFKHRIAE